jgi:hypothetical protein
VRLAASAKEKKAGAFSIRMKTEERVVRKSLVFDNEAPAGNTGGERINNLTNCCKRCRKLEAASCRRSDDEMYRLDGNELPDQVQETGTFDFSVAR